MSVSGEPNPALRAKDTDRDAVVEVLNGAFVEGQLDAVEHQRRVDVALAAPTVGSLSVLTADLQLSQQVLYDLAARGIVALVPVSTPEPKTKLVWAKGRLAALAVGLLLVAGCLGIGTVVAEPDSEPTSGIPSINQNAARPAPVIDQSYLEKFVRAYETRFQKTLVVSVATEHQGLRVVVPAVGSASRSAIYSYDGERFTREPGTSPAAEPVDLADLDTARIGALADRAAGGNTQDPKHVDLLIGRTGHGPGVQLSVRESDGGLSTTTADMRGRVTSSSP